MLLEEKERLPPLTLSVITAVELIPTFAPAATSLATTLKLPLLFNVIAPFKVATVPAVVPIALTVIPPELDMSAALELLTACPVVLTPFKVIPVDPASVPAVNAPFTLMPLEDVAKVPALLEVMKPEVGVPPVPLVPP